MGAGTLKTDFGPRGSADLCLEDKAMSRKTLTAENTAATTETDAPNCDHCGVPDAHDLPADHRLAAEFDALCADCAGMSVCTEAGCDAAFFDFGARAAHVRNEHGSDDGDHECPHCGELVEPSAIVSDDPRMRGRGTQGRKSYICPACGHGLRGVASDAGRLI